MRAKLLVIEDEPDVRENILEILVYEEFNVLEAANGLVGVQLARQHLPDLIVCDVMMPELDGYGVLSELRRDSVTATIPFIFLTAKTDRESVRKGMELGADDYLSKPFTPDELLAAVKTRLEKQTIIENQRLHMLSRKLVKAQEIERHRIARELYDEVGQPLTGLKFLLEMIGRIPPDAISARMDEAQALVDELMARVNELSLDLRPAILDHLGLLSALLWFFERYTSQTQVRVNFEHTDMETRLPSDVEIAAYRIVQEALNNVARHAGVSEVAVQLHIDLELLYVEVEDQGIGFDLEAVLTSDASSGLAGMSERARSQDGQLMIESFPGAGTCVTARLPLNELVERPRIRADMPQAVFGAEPAGAASKPAAPSSALRAHPRRFTSKTEIVLADAHDVVRQGLRALLEAEPELSIVGETADGLEVADLVEQLNPDVLVMALMMPGLNGLDATRQVRQRSPQTHVLILSAHTNEAYVQEALKNGADGFALKAASASELLQAVHDVAAGRRYLSPLLSERAIESYISGQKAENTEPDTYGVLTNREREVFHLAAEGYKNAEIADRLSISPRTVETHRANLMRKLSLRTQTDLVRYAMRRGILALDD